MKAGDYFSQERRGGERRRGVDVEEERRTGTMFLERSSSKRRGQESSHFESHFQMSLRTWGKKTKERRRRFGRGGREKRSS